MRTPGIWIHLKFLSTLINLICGRTWMNVYPVMTSLGQRLGNSLYFHPGMHFNTKLEAQFANSHCLYFCIL